jgi:hypothetical protein
MIIKKPMNNFTNGGRRGRGSRDDHPKNWGHEPIFKNWGHEPIGNGGLPKPIPGGGVTPPPRVNTLYQRGGAVSNRKFKQGGKFTSRQGGGSGRSSTHYGYHYDTPAVGYHNQYQMRFMDTGKAYSDTVDYIDVSTQAECQSLGGNWSTAWGNSGICNISSPNFTMGYLHPQGHAASGKHIHDVNLDGTVNVQDVIEVRNTALAEGNSYNRGGSVHRSRKGMYRHGGPHKVDTFSCAQGFVRKGNDCVLIGNMGNQQYRSGGSSLDKRAINSGWQQYTKFPEVRDHYPECGACPSGCYPVGDCQCNCWA